jgi:hypothetical protein
MASESVVCKERRRGRWRRRAFSRELSGFSDAEKRDRERIDRLGACVIGLHAQSARMHAFPASVAI